MNSQLAKPQYEVKDHHIGKEEQLALIDTAIKQYQASNAPDLTTKQVTLLQNNAISFARKVLQANPGHIEAINVLARIELDRGNLPAASDLVETALALDTATATSWYTQGQIALAKAQLTEAEASFIRCIELDPRFFKAHTSYAYTKLLQGNLIAGFEHYRKLGRIQPKDSHVRAKLFECLRQLQADYDNKELAKDVYEYLNWQDVNYNDLATMCASLLIHRYQLDKEDTQLDIAELGTDPLVLLSLEKLFYTNTLIERIFTQIRQHLLFSESQKTERANQPLIVALGCQAYNNEYIYAVTSSEMQYVEHLRAEAARYTLQDIFAKQHTLALIAMYGPLSTVLPEALLSQIQVEHWHPVYQPVMKRCIHMPRKHASFNAFTTVGDIRNPISCAVKEQYESNPYPRWLALDYHTPTTYVDSLINTLPGFTPPNYLNDSPINVLVAGCGTGRQALHIARYFRNTQVTAVDISRASLQYAGQMAKRYNIHNIQFIQADILSLDNLPDRFHIIECSGVLHHMQSPLMGAQKLMKLLVPGGLLKLGLYSERARRQVVKVRELIQHKQLSPTADNIRQLRTNIIEDTTGAYNDIIRSADFFTLSGCRDLLWHVQEHRFTPQQLQQLIDKLGMEFLGFSHITNNARKAYQQKFPEDICLTQLQNWEIFEQEYPQTFASMYQFFLQKPLLQ